MSEIQVNGRFLNANVTGVQRYAREICRLRPNWRIIQPTEGVRAIGNIWEQFVLPVKVSKRGILWSPANAGPIGCTNQVVTIHDAAAIKHPEWFSRSFSAWYRFMWPLLASRCRRVLTVSEFCRGELVQALRLSPEKIAVVPNGGDHLLEIEEERPLIPETILQDAFFLCVGSLDPRKNIDCLLRAWAAADLKNATLIVVGGKGKSFASIEAFPICETVYFADRLPDSNLVWLYRRAISFVAPSFYEGFGIPPLEALFFQCPVIASDIAVHREVLGAAVNYFNPWDQSELTDWLREKQARVLSLEERLAGEEVQRKYTWEASAAEVERNLSEVAQ